MLDYIEISPVPGAPQPIVQLTNHSETHVPLRALPPMREYIVDDEDSGIRYTGEWAKVKTPAPTTPIDRSIPESEENMPLTPYGQGWASTSVNGSAFEFDFTGKSCALAMTM